MDFGLTMCKDYPGDSDRLFCKTCTAWLIQTPDCESRLTAYKYLSHLTLECFQLSRRHAMPPRLRARCWFGKSPRHVCWVHERSTRGEEASGGVTIDHRTRDRSRTGPALRELRCLAWCRRWIRISIRKARYIRGGGGIAVSDDKPCKVIWEDRCGASHVCDRRPTRYWGKQDGPLRRKSRAMGHLSRTSRRICCPSHVLQRVRFAPRDYVKSSSLWHAYILP